jgi:hypothetical protein
MELLINASSNGDGVIEGVINIIVILITSAF